MVGPRSDSPKKRNFLFRERERGERAPKGGFNSLGGNFLISGGLLKVKEGAPKISPGTGKGSLKVGKLGKTPWELIPALEKLGEERQHSGLGLTPPIPANWGGAEVGPGGP